MRFAAAGLLSLLLADAAPRNGSFRETRWVKGDFVAATNDLVDRLTDSGDVVGIRIRDRGESCLIRRRAFPLRPPCRLRFRMKWSDAKFGAAYPSVHVLLNPPAPDQGWWKKPIEGGRWSGQLRTFLFHFSTDHNWRVYGPTEALESAGGRHLFSPAENRWIDIEIKLDGKYADVFVDGKEVAGCELDLKGTSTFTYGIGDQTSTFVELADFLYEAQR